MLCRPGPNREEKVLTIICHLFCQSRLPPSTAAWAQTKKAETGPSVVILQKLSEIGDMVKGKDGRLMREGACVKDILIEHNSRALKALVAYTACFVEAYPELGPDNILPLSHCRFPISDDSAPSAVSADKFDLGECMRGLLLPKLSVRSSFVALSGHDDEFSSIDEVSSSARRGVFLDPKMVVYMYVRMYVCIYVCI